MKGSWKWLPLASLGALLWVGLYIMFWLDRSDCLEGARAECLGDAFGNWLGDVVMLRWIDSTLAAGALTLIAGAFAVLTFLWQRSDQRRRQTEEKVYTLVSTLAALEFGFAAASTHVTDEQSVMSRLDAVEKIAEGLVAQAPREAYYALGAVMSMRIKVNEYRSNPSTTYGLNALGTASSIGAVACDYFEGLSDNVDAQGRVRWSRRTLTDNTRHLLESRLYLDWDDLPLKGYFLGFD